MLPDFVRIEGRSFEIVLAPGLRNRETGQDIGWYVQVRAARIFINGSLGDCDRLRALARAVRYVCPGAVPVTDEHL